eukprot:gene57948-biopygen101337
MASLRQTPAGHIAQCIRGCGATCATGIVAVHTLHQDPYECWALHRSPTLATQETCARTQQNFIAAEQSTTTSSHNAIATRAIDGSVPTSWTGDSCVHTDAEAEPWWRGDLGKIVTLASVSIFGRHDCCPCRSQKLEVHIGTTSDRNAATLVSSDVSASPSDADVTVSGTHQARVYGCVTSSATESPTASPGCFVGRITHDWGYVNDGPLLFRMSGTKAVLQFVLDRKHGRELCEGDLVMRQLMNWSDDGTSITGV